MMKKIIAMLLSLALLLGCTAGMAEDAAAEKEIFGHIQINGEFTLKGILPEGYRIVPFEESEDAFLALINSDDPTQPRMTLAIAYDETYSDVERLNDLGDEELALLEKTFTDTDPYAMITYDETALGTRLLVCRTTAEEYDSLDIFSIYRGYFVEFVMTPGEEAEVKQLTDEQIESCNVFLSELDFVSGIEQAELKTAGNTFTANITGYDEKEKTIDLTLLVPLTLTQWQVYSMNEGDTVQIGMDEVEIATLVFEGDDALVNDEYSLTLQPDGMYTVRMLDYPVLREAKTLTVPVTENLEFLEGINAETGEFLMEQKKLTGEDLFSALRNAEQGGIGFDSQNITVTFDGEDQLVQVIRDYAPWQ